MAVTCATSCRPRAKRAGQSIYFTGIDPGFVTDALAITMSSVCCRIEQLRTWEFIDYSNYPVPEVMLGMGYGRLPQDIPTTAASVCAPDGAARSTRSPTPSGSSSTRCGSTSTTTCHREP